MTPDSVQVLDDTVRVALHDMTVVRDTICSAAKGGAGDAGNDWFIAIASASIAFLGALAVQGFRVWLDRKITKRHLVELLTLDLDAFKDLIESAIEEHTETPNIMNSYTLAAMDEVLRSYQTYEGQLTVFPTRTTRTIRNFVRAFVGWRATLRRIDERNAPKDHIDSLFATLSTLLELCRRAEAHASVERHAQYRLEDWFWSRTWLGSRIFMRWVKKRQKEEEGEERARRSTDEWLRSLEKKSDDSADPPQPQGG